MYVIKVLSPHPLMGWLLKWALCRVPFCWNPDRALSTDAKRGHTLTICLSKEMQMWTAQDERKQTHTAIFL